VNSKRTDQFSSASMERTKPVSTHEVHWHICSLTF
jgi:hypothetical protein